MVEAAGGGVGTPGMHRQDISDAVVGVGVGAVADIDGKEAHKEQSRYKNYYDDGHGGAEICIGTLKAVVVVAVVV